MSNWRSKKLTQSAKHEACVSCGADDGTVVWAHSNEQRHGKGMGIRAHDLFGAYLCRTCHEAYDQRKKQFYPSIGDRCGCVNVENYNDWFREQWEKSMILACEKGYL